jgi:hypothetical protein
MTGFSHARDLTDFIATEPWRVQVLRAVARLGLPDCWVCAGFLRSPVWDRLHGYATPSPLADIDVIYHDPGGLDPARDAAFEQRLQEFLPGCPWEVSNQARMHIGNGDTPYRSSAEALRHWLETPTAVGLRMTSDGTLDLLAPFGLEDLFAMVVRPTPHAAARRMAAFRRRVQEKDWLGRWPKVQVLDDPVGPS